MLVRHATTKGRVVLFDFLAPALLGYRNASTARRPHVFTREEFVPPSPSSTDPKQFQEKIRKQFNLLGSSSSSGPSDSEVAYFNDATHQLRQALAKKNLDKAWTLWSALEEKSLLQFLSTAQLDSYSRLIASFCPQTEKDPWDGHRRDVVEHIAIVTASGGATTALQVCMDFHIKRKEPEAVLRLYQKYDELWDNGHSLEEELQEVEDEPGGSQEIAEPSPGSQSSYGTGRYYLVLSAITAHAMRDSFKDALHLALEFRLRLGRPSVTLFLKTLSHEEELHRKVSQYVRILDTARLVSQPTSLSRQISNLTNDQAIHSLEKHYNNIQAGFNPPYPYLAATPEAISPERPVLMPMVGWTSFTIAFLKCGKLDLAERLWNDMVAQGLKPGVEMWTALLDGYSAIRAVDESLTTWDAMRSANVKPDCMAYRAFLSILFDMRKPDFAMARFKDFEESGLKEQAHASVSLPVYNTVLHGLLLNRMENEARALYKKMKEHGPSPDVVSYNTFMQYCARKGDMKSFARWLQALTEVGLVGDVFTWSTVLSALFKAGRKDGPEMVTNIMRIQKIEPNVATYTSIVDYAVRERDELMLKAAFDLLKWMEQQEPEVRPNQVTYTSILSGMYRDEWLNPTLREECKKYILKSMQARKMQLTRVTYHILLKACLQNPEPEGLRQALDYYNEMGQRKIHKGYDTWYTILLGLVRRNDWEVAEEMVNEIRRTGFVPSGGLLNLIHKVYARPGKKGGRHRPV